ncbi:MAG: hypothetical protein Q4D51_13660 [Eubacteriales bacterium]|nr:hypothetical protein [Eubacteriales bacterium]
MAKKNKNKGEKNEDGIMSKIVSGFFVILIIAVWLVILGALVRFDIGGFGSSVLRPILKDVPVVNKILPDPTDEELAAEAEVSGEENPVATLAQAKEMIAKLQEENEKLTAKNKSLKVDKADLTKEVERLKVFEDNQNEFQAQKEEFYREIVYGENAPDADTYSKWYESIDAAHAEAIYRQVVADQAVDDEVKKVAKTYENMKPSEAAAVLEKVGNLDVVAEVLSAMKADARAKVMDQMDKNLAASVTKKLMP